MALRHHSSRLARSTSHSGQAFGGTLGASLLTDRLAGAERYDRIAGYFSSSLLALAGEALASVEGGVRVVCNADLNPDDVRTARAARDAQRAAWGTSRPEAVLDGAGADEARIRFGRLYELLRSGRLDVRVLPDAAVGFMHGKAGVIRYADGRATSFLGSANESLRGWMHNYELVWEDDAPESVAWVQGEFDALWTHSLAHPLAEAVVEDVGRLARRHVLPSVRAWKETAPEGEAPDPAPAVIETPLFREQVGLWPHQRHFVETVFEAHHGPERAARFVLADQVGLGKTLQLGVSAQLIALTTEGPILVVAPKTLLAQWQAELNDLLGLPSARWTSAGWIDEHGVLHPASSASGLLKCPRRVGLVSSGLISYGGEASHLLLRPSYALVVLDEAHRARRRNLRPGTENEVPDPNNLLRFMQGVAQRTRSLLLATATPVQLFPVEAHDLLSVLGTGSIDTPAEGVLGNAFSPWRTNVPLALNIAMAREKDRWPTQPEEQWLWLRNPLPPASEDVAFDRLRRRLGVSPEVVVSTVAYPDLPPAARAEVPRAFAKMVAHHHPFIRRIVRRTRKQLEETIDAETKEPLLSPVRVRLHGESDAEALALPAYLSDAYAHAEAFCQSLAQRREGGGLLRTLLLRRVGSSLHAGRCTALALLSGAPDAEDEEDEGEDAPLESPAPSVASSSLASRLLPEERESLRRFADALAAHGDRDPKHDVVLTYLLTRGWLQRGCIVFSQYRDSLDGLLEALSAALPEERIALYSGETTSLVRTGAVAQPISRERIKSEVRSGALRLVLGTDAASEGLNLQRLGTLINLDLPWNPTRLEQRKGRIQRIGQVHEEVDVLNLRYRGSVEDRVHALLSSRLANIHDLFGQIPDVLNDVWIAEAQGHEAEVRRLIDALPAMHPFDVRNATVSPRSWSGCAEVLNDVARHHVLKGGW